MKAKEKRKLRGYKCAESPYRKAMKRAQKEKIKLGTWIEKLVVAYSEGQCIEIFGAVEKLSMKKLDEHKNEGDEAVRKTPY